MNNRQTVATSSAGKYELTIGRSAVLLNSGWVVDLVLGLVFVGFASRTIAAPEYGVLLFALALSGLLMSLEFGASAVLIPRFVAHEARDERREASLLLGSSILAMVAAGGGALAVATLVAAALPMIGSIPEGLIPAGRAVVIAAGLIAAFTLPTRALELQQESGGRFRLLAGLRVGAAVARFGALVATLASGYGIVALAYVHVAVAAARLLATMLTTPGARSWEGGAGGRAYMETIRSIYRDGRWAALDNTSRQLGMTADAFLLAMVAAPEVVAVYAIGSRLPVALWALFGRGIGASIRTISQLHAAGDEEELRSAFAAALRLAVTGAWPILAVGIVFADSVLAIWVPQEYWYGSATMRVLFLAGAAFSIHAGTHVVLYVRGQVRQVALASTVESAGNVAMTLVLGAMLGAVGAAIATAATVIVSTGLYFVPTACRSLHLSWSELRSFFPPSTFVPVVATSVVSLIAKGAIPDDQPFAECVAAGVILALASSSLAARVLLPSRSTGSVSVASHGR